MKHTAKSNETKSTINRRDFLKKGATGVASLGILGAAGPVLGADDIKKGKPAKKGNMIHRTLGKTGIKIPIVNMGVMNADNPNLLKRAYESGMRHFDTAANYQRGKNEEMVGKVVKELNIRDKVVIGTKIYLPEQRRGIDSAKKKEFFLKTMEECLKRLQTDYVDIMYIHSVSETGFTSDPGVKEAMLRMKKEGKAKHIGFTTHANMTEVLNEGIDLGIYEVVEIAFNYSMHQNIEMIKAMKKTAAKGIGLVAMKTQCQQPWYRKHYEPKDSHALYEGKLVHSALLKWVMKHPFITTAIPGFTTFEQLDEDITVAYNLDYSPEEKKFLEDRAIKTALASVCQMCGSCVSTCPRGADIPNLMRTHMYAANYSNFYQARDTLREIARGRGLDACSSCSSCGATCANRVDIAGRLDELKVIYT